jgi:hypothetical protein
VKNQQVGARTKHIDVRHHHLREHYELKNFEIKYVRSEDNESDILTKNTTEKILDTHAKNIRNGTLMAWREYPKAIETVAAAWRENVKNVSDTNESWTKVRRRPTKNQSSLRKSKYSPSNTTACVTDDNGLSASTM